MKALITGIYGQDARYLATLLLSRGYEVIGTRRGNERFAQPGVKVVYGDVTDAACMLDLMVKHRPDEVYNLAAVTHVGDSFSAVTVAHQINAIGCANVLEAATRIGAKVYQASTSEIFGSTPPPQHEGSLFHPRSPYAVAKLSAHMLTRTYRARGHYVAAGILFNHESPLRGDGFVTQKVAKAAARKLPVTLGNLDACRDWGHAVDYVSAMWLMMQQPQSDEYVVATGVMKSVRDLCEVAYRHVGLDWRDYVSTSPEFVRPLEVEQLCGDASKIKALGWKPTRTFEDTIREMVNAAANF